MGNGPTIVRWFVPLLVTLAIACSDPRGQTEGTEVPASRSPHAPDTSSPPPSRAILAWPTGTLAASEVLATLAPTAGTPVQVDRSDFIVTVAQPTIPATVTVASLSASSLSPSAEVITPEATQDECEHNAQFVSDVSIPDDAPMDPGEAFVKTWRFQNSGTCDWDSGIELAFVSGDQMEAPSRVLVTATQSLGTVDVSVPLSAPMESGTYTGYWRLQTSEGKAIGEPVFVRIVVPSASTPAAVQETSSVPPLVLLNYFAWYDAGGWDDCNISAGDRPLAPYHSDDPAAIGRHIQSAMQAGANGFTLQWFAPGDRTDRNFATLLRQSEGTTFRSTIVFLRHIWHGSPAASQSSIAEAIRYVLDHHSHHPNFLTVHGRPVLFFTDLYRVASAENQSPQQAWAAIREQVDPGGNAWWIGEGLDASYLSVFDGLWVYKITHAVAPQAYLKASQWANAVRAWENRTGQEKLWIATVSPGWDDTRAGCRTDVRVPSAAHRQARGDGAFFRATFDAALDSNPDWLWINSFNEWVEGTYVEPSELYGSRFVELAEQFSRAFKGR